MHCLLAALFLAFSAAALAGHSVIHAGAGAEQCMLCASHADPQGAGPVVAAPVLVDPGLQTTPGIQGDVHLPGGSEFSPQPRAPPAIS